MISARTARIDDNLGRGTDGSNQVPSSAESVAKANFLALSLRNWVFFRAPMAANEAEARAEMEQVWRPEGVWAAFIGRSC